MNTLCHELSTILLPVLPVNPPLGVILELELGSSKRFKPVYITLPWQRGWSGSNDGPTGVGESAILQNSCRGWGVVECDLHDVILFAP